MSRIQNVFDSLRANNKKALIPYLTAGDPQPGFTVSLMHTLVKAGADIIEVGVPFSDPMADGPTIQLACERALAFNVSLSDVLDMVAEFRQTNNNTPVVLMGYLNPIEVMGYESFASRAHSVGVDGLLTVDMPPEESLNVLSILEKFEIDPIFLVSPESTSARFSLIAKHSKGFIYYVSLKGVTGVKRIDIPAVSNKLSQLRELTRLPIGVGFGINDAESAAAVATIADAVVVGSSIVKRIADNVNDQDKMEKEIHEFLSELRNAIDGV